MSNKINIKNPKVKSLILTILEVLIVAGLIFGVLMFIYNKVNKDADITSGTVNTKEQKSKKAQHYIISVNKCKNTLVVYNTPKDVSKRSVVKVFKCSVGSKVKEGTYKTSLTYSWIHNNGKWHQYNVSYDENSCIQSVSYDDKYPNTLNKKSYKQIGAKQKVKSNILLYSSDAYWIAKHCGRGVIVEIIKGKKTDALPGYTHGDKKLVKYCGFDPTDPVKSNPYKKMKKDTISVGLKTVTVEKGKNINYLNNIIALDSKGNIITNKLKHKKIDTNDTKTVKVSFSYKNMSKAVVKYKIVDTTPPVVNIAGDKFVLKLKNLDKKTVLKQSNIDKIKKMVLSASSANEPGCIMSVQTIDKDDLNEGKVSVVVLAKDKAGNVGSNQTYVDVKVKVEKVTKYRPSDAAKKRALAKLKKKQKAKEKARKKAKKNKKKKKNKNKIIETKNQIDEATTEQFQ